MTVLAQISDGFKALAEYFSDPLNHNPRENRPYSVSRREFLDATHDDSLFPKIHLPVLKAILQDDNFFKLAELQILGEREPDEYEETEVSLRDLFVAARGHDFIGEALPTYRYLRASLALDITYNQNQKPAKHTPVMQSDKTQAIKSLAKLVRKLQRLNPVDLNGGRVMTESEFIEGLEAGEFEDMAKDELGNIQTRLAKGIVVTNKNHPRDSHKRQVIDIIFPDAYAAHLNNKDCSADMNLVLGHEFYHAQSNACFEFGDQVFEVLMSSTSAAAERAGLESTPALEGVADNALEFQMATSEIRAHMTDLETMQQQGPRNKGCTKNTYNTSKRWFITHLVELEDEIVFFEQATTKQDAQKLRKLCYKYINEAFEALSPEVKADVNALLQEYDLSTLPINLLPLEGPPEE